MTASSSVIFASISGSRSSGGDSLWERQDHPAARGAAAAVVELHRVVIHRQYNCRDVGRVGVAVFRIDDDRIAAGDDLDTRLVTTPLFLVGQDNQRVTDDLGTFARRLQFVDSGGRVINGTGQPPGDSRHHAHPVDTYDVKILSTPVTARQPHRPNSCGSRDISGTICLVHSPFPTNAPIHAKVL